MPRGYIRALYIRPFDHRACFQFKLFGWKPPLSEAQTTEIVDAKQLIYDGFRLRASALIDRSTRNILLTGRAMACN